MLGHLLWVIAVILALFAIADVMKSSRDTATKVVLVAIILLLPIVAPAVYLLVFREKGY